MPNVGIYVDGQKKVVPGALGIVDVSGFNRARPPLGQRSAIIAKSLGGIARGWMELTPRTYADVVAGGNALKAMDLFVDPAGDLSGPAEWDFYRMDAATRAQASLGNLLVKVKPELAGTRGNNFTIERKIPVTDATAFVLELTNFITGITETSTNLGPAIEIEYVGAGTGVTMAVTLTSGVKKLVLTSSVGAELVEIVLGPDGIATFSELEDAINATSVWTGKVLYDHFQYATIDTPVAALTVTTNKSIINLGVLAQVAWLAGSAYVEGEVVVAAGVNGIIPFSGGGEGAAPLTSDYLAAIASALQRDIQNIWTDSTDTAVAAALSAHCKIASQPSSRRERRGFFGITTAASKTQQALDVIGLARSLNDKRMTVSGTPFKRTNIRTGKLETYNANYMAIIAMGMDASVTAEVDLTTKIPKIASLVYDYDELTDIAGFIEGGVWSILYDWEDKVFRVADDVTTYQKDANLYNRLRFGMRVQDYLVRKVRGYVKPFTGEAGDEFVVESIKNAADRAFDEEVRTLTSPRGVLVGYDETIAEYDGIETVNLTCGVFGVGRIGHIIFRLTIKPREVTV